MSARDCEGVARDPDGDDSQNANGRYPPQETFEATQAGCSATGRSRPEAGRGGLAAEASGLH